jgi:ribosomal protein L11 methylase PrmA
MGLARSVFDVGAARACSRSRLLRLGIGPVAAVDVDEIAVEAARANARANGISIDVRCTDALRRASGRGRSSLGESHAERRRRARPARPGRAPHHLGYLDRDTPRLEGRAVRS